MRLEVEDTDGERDNSALAERVAGADRVTHAELLREGVVVLDGQKETVEEGWDGSGEEV